MCDTCETSAVRATFSFYTKERWSGTSVRVLRVSQPRFSLSTRGHAVVIKSLNTKTSQHTVTVYCDCCLEKQNDGMPKYVESLIFPNRMQKDIKLVKVHYRIQRRQS